ETFTLQDSQPGFRRQTLTARQPRRRVLVQPPPVQKPKRHVVEQALAGDLVEQQQDVAPQRRLDVTQRTPDVAGRLQHVGGNDEIVAARVDTLPGNRLFEIK